MIYENKIQQKTAAVFIVSTLVLANKVCVPGLKYRKKRYCIPGEKISVNEKDETNIEGNHSRVYYILFTGNN